MSRLLFPLFLIILAGVLFFQFTDPMLAEIEELRVEQARLESGLANAKKLREVQQQLLETYNAYPVETLGRLNKFLPDNIDNVRLIIDINNIARRYGMTIRDIKFSTDQNSETGGNASSQTLAPLQRGTVVMGFNTTGSYLNFQAFLNDLARSLRLVDVVSVDFTSTDVNDVYQYNVELQTYWLQ